MTSPIRRLFGIGSDEVHFKTRGFRLGRSETRQRLEQVGEVFLIGYHTALEEPEERKLSERLKHVELVNQGFAFEGAAMALALRDRLLPGSRRLAAFMQGSGRRHIYMLHVGAGWALARVPWRLQVDKAIQCFDPLLRWLAVDGYGFHEGYFHWRAKSPPVPPRGLSGDGLHAFDQGLGRAVWFTECGDVERIAQTVQRFSESRHRDLWSGVGLAAAYAGGVSRADLTQLGNIAVRPALAQGAAFAAKARELAGNWAPETELACEVFCHTSAKVAAQTSDEALAHLKSITANPRYRDWVISVEEKLTAASQSHRQQPL
jgi:hypothetical protein